MLEKYLAFVSVAFSAACGLTISSPCNGVNAIEDDVPEICFLTLVLPEITINNFDKIDFVKLLNDHKMFKVDLTSVAGLLLL